MSGLAGEIVARWPLVVGAYLVGSLSFSVAVVWLLQRRDLRSVGSGNAGATNVLRVAGALPAFAVLVLDVAKGAVPVLVARASGAPLEVAAAAGAAAVAGHVFPVFFGFRGGKGVATAAGALGALLPLAVAAVVPVFLLVVALSRYVSLGSIVAAILIPGFEWLFGRLGWAERPSATLLAIASSISGLVIFKHRENLRRLVAGNERKLGEGGH